MENVAKTAEDHSSPPVIDLALFGVEGQERRRIGQKIAEACETWGFFHITNHGVHPSLIERTKKVFTEFFHLPKEEKMKIEAITGRLDNYYHEGYRNPHGTDKHVLTKATEFLYNVYGTGIQAEIDRQPSNPPSFRSTVAEYAAEMDVLGRKLLGLMSEQLGLPQETLQQYMSRTQGIRGNYYQPSESDESDWTVPAHTDPVGVTLLLSDEVAGTQIKKDDKWVQLNLVPGALLFNVGDQVEILSNGRFQSVEHRGLPHKTQHRLSIATFISPDLTTVVGPLPQLVDESHPPLYKTQPYSSHFTTFLRKGLVSKSVLEDAKVHSS